MKRFKNWFEALESDKEKQLRDVWADTFKSLGIGGLSDEDAANQSLSNITYGARSSNDMRQSTFKGKRAAYKRLENGQIFNRLQQLGDPEINKGIEDAKRWLGQNDVKSNGDTTVSTVLQKLFGPKHFERLIDSDVPHVDAKIDKAPAQPPKQDMGMTEPEPQMDPNMDPSQDPAMQNPMQMPQQQQPPQPQRQMRPQVPPNGMM